MRSGSAAAAWAESQSTFSPVNNCLRAVLVAYDVLGQIEPLARADATATEAWDLAHSQHPGDHNPPRGALVCFPNWGKGKSGHIAIGLGGDRVRSTGINTTAYFTGTIAQVAARCGNPYAGWAGDFAGTSINFTSTASGGTSMTDFDQLTVKRGGKAIPALQELADTKTLGMANADALKRLEQAVATIGTPTIDDAKLEAMIDRAVAKAAVKPPTPTEIAVAVIAEMKKPGN